MTNWRIEMMRKKKRKKKVKMEYGRIRRRKEREL